MKNIGLLLTLGVAAIAAVWLGLDDMLLGRNVVDPSNVPVPDVNADPNSVADSAQGGADKVADQVASWDGDVWKLIVIGLTALGITWAWFTSTKFKWAVIGGGIAVIVVVGFVTS